MGKITCSCASALLVAFCCWNRQARAQTDNFWINPTSGNWEDSQNWSAGFRPGPGQKIHIQNPGWKAVAIGPNTTASFPESMKVSSIDVEAPTDSRNLLLLNYAGLDVPLVSGEVVINTNGFITALASGLDVSTNVDSASTGELNIFGAFNQGADAIVNAHIISLGNVTNAGAGPGNYNETNGTVNADAISAWMGSTFNQFDGANTIVGSLSLGGADANNFAHYSMASGSLTAGSIELQRGDFNQSGGSVTSGLDIASATYTLSAGTLQLPGITIPNAHFGIQNPFPNGMNADATLLQTGGTNFCNGSMTVYHEYGAPGVPLPFFGPGRYVLSNGVLCVSSTVRAWLGSFQQWGGWHTNAGTEVAGDTFPNLVIQTGSFILGGGTLITPSITVGLGDFTQSGGINQVSGEVGVGTAESPATFTLSGGLLTDLNTTLAATNPATPGAQNAFFTQTGGTHIITNLLLLAGQSQDRGNYYPFVSTGYVLSNGVLNVPNIEIDSKAFFEHDGGTLTTSGLLTLGYATWNENTSGQQFGQLLLSAPAGTNATFSLPSSRNCIVHFANSSSVAWSNQAGLLIVNWNGSLSGGGNHQVFFGSDSSGLTAQQLSQIQFKNPSGENGNFPARILSTGEIVPDRILLSHRSGNSLVLEWGSGSVLQTATNLLGPWQDLGSASSPYTVNFNGPVRFFRVRQ